MRTITGATSVVKPMVRLKIKDANGDWQNVSTRVYSLRLSDSIDQDGPSLDVTFGNAYHEWVSGTNNSLDPNDTASSYFVNSQPLLGCNHEVSLEISKNSGSNYYTVFEGFIGSGSVTSSVNVEGDDTVVADILSLENNLKRYFFTSDTVYEESLATAIGNAILSENGFGYTLKVIDDPAYMVSYYRVRDTNIWDSIKKMFIEVGYIFRVKWDSSGTPGFKPCVYDPGRVSTISSVDATFDGDFRARRISRNEADVRTKVIVEYRDGATGAIGSEYQENTTSRDKYGIQDGVGGRKHLIMRYSVKDESLIDSPAEATNLASYILHDLEEPSPDVEVSIPWLYPSMEVHDSIRFVGQDYTVDVGVAAWSWDLGRDNEFGTTTIEGMSNRVIGLASTWLEKDERSPDGRDDYERARILGDGRPPEQVTGLSLHTQRSQNVSGQTVSTVWATWTPVSNWDLDHYEVWAKIVDRRVSPEAVVDNWRLHGCVRQASFQFNGIPPGLDLDVKIYAVDWEWLIQ